jgi:hypothetical protein
VTRSLKAGALGLVIVGLLATVALASRGTHPGASGNGGTRAVPDSVQDAFITLLVVAYGVAIVAIVVAAFRTKHRFQDPKTRWLANFALVVLLMLVVTAIGYYGMQHSWLRERVTKATHTQTETQTDPQSRFRARPIDTREAQFQWPIVLALGGLVALGGIWMYARRRRVAVPRETGTLEDDIVSALETTIDDLRRERDARKAVIAAYAQMERALTSHGLARSRAETPLEYLGRVLRELAVRDTSVRNLTELFEYAKFSPHEIDDAMKEQAIAALAAVRDDLKREEAMAA